MNSGTGKCLHRLINNAELNNRWTRGRYVHFSRGGALSSLHKLLLQPIIYVREAVIRTVRSNNAQFNYQGVTRKAHCSGHFIPPWHNIQFRGGRLVPRPRRRKQGANREKEKERERKGACPLLRLSLEIISAVDQRVRARRALRNK